MKIGMNTTGANSYQKTANLQGSAPKKNNVNGFSDVLKNTISETMHNIRTNEAHTKNFTSGNGGDVAGLSINTAKLAVEVEGITALTQKFTAAINDITKMGV